MVREEFEINSQADFAHFLKKTRKQRRLQQIDFEGVSQASISKIEKSKTGCLLSRVLQISKFLGYKVVLVKIIKSPNVLASN